MEVKNIFENIPFSIPEEITEDIFSKPNFRIERIISEGHSSPKDFWYDQDQNEFVMLLSGSAVLVFDNNEKINLNPGDYLIINAHTKHRVEETDAQNKSIWLAVYF